MKVEDIVKFRGPQLAPEEGDEVLLAELRTALLRHEYSQENLLTLFGTKHILLSEMPGYIWRCRRLGTPLAHLALLFQLCQSLPRTDVDAVLSPSLVDALLAREILKATGDDVRAQVDLYEAQGTFVFTDHNVGMVRFSRHVYEPGTDSYTCLRTTPRRKAARVLDLCCGSGLQALLAAPHADEVVGVDVNPRALAFARVNAALNGVRSKTRFVQGDLYKALADDEAAFDLIVSNPPWIATPEEKMQLYRTGGEDGEALTRPIVQGLPRHLTRGGRLAMFVIFPIVRGQAYLQRVQSWLGGGRGWGVSLITFGDMSLESFIASHIAGQWEWNAHVEAFARWMDLYAQRDIEAMASGMVYVTRLGDDDEGWAQGRRMPLPVRDMSLPLERWLDLLAQIHRPDWPTKSLTLARDVVHFGVDLRSGEAHLEFTDGWATTDVMDRETIELVSRIVQGRDLDDLERLRRLALRGILE